MAGIGLAMTKAGGKPLLQIAACAALLLLGASFIPSLWCSREAGAAFEDSLKIQEPVQKGVEEWLSRGISAKDYDTGFSQFDGEWLFGTYFMAGMGFVQMAELHPELKARNIPLAERCIEGILSKETRAFDLQSWGSDPIESLDSDASSHIAYLGYLNLLLGMDRRLNQSTKFAPLNDKISAALARRYERSPTLLLETYPGETYPVDNCAGISSLKLFDVATGANHSALLARWKESCEKRWIDKRTGLLVQSVSPDGEPFDKPRGSGSTLGLYFLSFSDLELAKKLYAAVKKELASSVLGFGGVREYPRGMAGRMDIDSGPIIFGYGFSATGFSLAGAKLFGDEAYFKKLYATAYFAGAPCDSGGTRSFATGGPLGGAILFATLTAKGGSAR